MRFPVKKLLFVVVTSMCVLCCKASSPRYSFNGYSTSDGLSNDFVEAMMVDNDGFLWVGTYDGLNKFDGGTFRTYRTSARDVSTLTGGNVNCIFQDGKGRIWVATQRGLNLYDGQQDNFSRVKRFIGRSISNIFEVGGDLWLVADDIIYIQKNNAINASEAIILPGEYIEKRITCSRMRGDTLWITTTAAKIIYIPVKSRQVFCLDLPEGLAAKITNIQSFEIDPGGNIWLGLYSRGIVVLSRNGRLVEQFSHDEFNERTIGSNNVWNFFVDRKNRMWVQCINGHLNLFDPATRGFIRYTPDRFNEQSISGSSVTCMVEDRYGNLWIGTHGSGLQCININRNRFEVFNPTFATNNYSDNNITCFASSDGNQVWVGTNDAGLVRFDIATGRSVNITVNDGISSNTITAICPDMSGNLWLGTWGGGLCKYNTATGITRVFTRASCGGDGINIINIKNLNIDNGTLWVANNDGNVYAFCLADECYTSISNFTRDSLPRVFGNNAVLVDSKKRIWISTQNGLFMVEDGRVRDFRQSTSADNCLRGENVQAVYEDKHKHIWVLTSSGLFLFDGNGGFFDQRQVSARGQNIKSIVESDDGELWMGTQNGIVVYDPRQKRVKHFTADDGLPTNIFSPNSAYKLPDGRVLLGSTRGFVMIDPKKRLMNTIKPKAYFTGFEIYNIPQLPGAKKSVLQKDINHTDTVYISHSQSIFSISFAAVDLFSNSKLRFRYIMEGFNSEWIEAKTRTATFTNLDPGQYTFRVLAVNSDNIGDNQGATLHLVVLPPWWEKMWFKLLAVLSLILLFLQWYLRTKYQKRQLKQMVMVRTQELSDALDEVQIQKDVVHIQKSEVEKQKNELSNYNRQITSSIEYAKHIQSAMLPHEEAWERLKDNYFIIYKPQHIVSGDFYWIKSFDSHTYVAVADCTGHGVPGALMSVMGISFIDQVINHNCTLGTAAILDTMRSMVKQSLRQHAPSGSARDGMDIVLCKVFHDVFKVEFSGANSSLYVLRKDPSNQGIEVLKGDKMPVGVHLVEKPFSSHELQLAKGDSIYLSSDGYADQVNDGNGKKLMSKTFRKLILSYSDLAMPDQGLKLSEEFDMWKGSAEQVDDVTVVGVKL